ncbi:MAG: hypothetical protein GY722_21975 [bacterium]|nr:hypothetical protein [bacterium]
MPSLRCLSWSKLFGWMALALAMFVALLPSPASGSMPGDNGEILVFGHVDGERGLYLLDLKEVSLTKLPIEAHDLSLHSAAWSPTGSHIAFIRSDSEHKNHGLWVFDMESGESTLLRNEPSGVHYQDVSWSPSGDEIVIGTMRRIPGDGSWSAGLFRVTPDGALVDEVEVAANTLGRVEWSPNGAEILLWLQWLDDDGIPDDRICLVPVGSDEVDCIASEGWWPSWSPSGDQIAFGKLPSSHLTIVDRTGEVVSEYVHSYGHFSTWSPDGRFIAFPSYLGEQEVGEYSIEILDLETRLRHAYVPGIENVLDLRWRPTRPDSGFLDVPDSSVFSGDVAWLGSTELTKGCNPPLRTHFCPDQPVTRGQLAAFLHRALGEDLPPVQPAAEFNDTEGSVFAADIAWLSRTGITRGCNPPDNTRFCPNEPVTRGQLAVFLTRAMNYTAGGGSDLFADDDGSVFEMDIDRLGTAGVTRGCNPPANTRFCPNEPVTRGQLAAFLHRAIESR